MKDQLISFDTAKLAKEKGFDWNVVNYYDKDKTKCSEYSDLGVNPENFNADFWNTKAFTPFYSAPTQSLLQKWLREEHRIVVYVITSADRAFRNILYDGYIGTELYIINKKTYEEALEEGLKEALKLI